MTWNERKVYIRGILVQQSTVNQIVARPVPSLYCLAIEYCFYKSKNSAACLVLELEQKCGSKAAGLQPFSKWREVRAGSFSQ